MGLVESGRSHTGVVTGLRHSGVSPVVHGGSAGSQPDSYCGHIG